MTSRHEFRASPSELGTPPLAELGPPGSPGEKDVRPAVDATWLDLQFSDTSKSDPLRGLRQGKQKSRLLLHLYRAGDTLVALLVLAGTFIVTNLGRMPRGIQEFLAVRVTVRNILVVACFLVFWRVVFSTLGLYNGTRIRSWQSELPRAASACAVASLALLTFPLLSLSGAFGYVTVLYFWMGATVAVLLTRLLLRTLTVSGSIETSDVIIVGSGPRAVRLSRELSGGAGVGYNLLGFVDSDGHAVAPAIEPFMLGRLEQLEDILMRRPIDEVLIALPIRSQYHEVQRVIEICQRGGVRARYLADVFENSRDPVPMDDDPRLLLKRTLDIVGALLGLILSLPIMALAAVAIRITSPGPALFAQERYGLNKRRFRMYKLRTMVQDAEVLQMSLEARNEASGPVFKIRNDPRVTRIGRILRRTSIDELPQLYNVLRGHMSLVGPRPMAIRDVNRFAEAALMRRFSVRPGLTCLWQTSGRSELGFENWIALDLQYIDHWSLTLDLMILLRTVPVVFSGRGAV